jgi:VWFA-related protein
MNHRVGTVQAWTVALLLISQPLCSQEPTISVDVKVVNVLATVQDKHGQFLRSLTRDDFLLEEDGRPQTIRYFAQESNLPLTLGLLVDTSLSQRRVLDRERAASYSFLDKMLHASKDVAFVIHFDHEVELLQDITPSHEKLESALRALETPSFTRDRGNQSPGSSGPRRGGMRGGRTLLYDAVFLASDELMKKQQGRKAIVVLSDGVDRGSKETLEQAIESAQRADTVVYSILFADDEPRGDFGGFGGRGGMGRHGGGGRYPQEARPDGKKVLERISRQTGGRMFEVSKKQTIEHIYDQVQDELRSQYNLGYTPDKTIGPGYRRIHLATKQKDLKVQARDGYYAER